MICVFANEAVLAADQTTMVAGAHASTDPLAELVREHDIAREREWWKRLRELYARRPSEVMAALTASPGVTELAGEVPAPLRDERTALPIADVPQSNRPPVELATAPVPMEAVAKELMAGVEPNPAVSPADRHVRGEKSAVQLDASAGGTTATIALSLPLTTYITEDKKQIRHRQWAITASSAVDKTGGSATFANLNGPANGASIGFDFNFSSADIASDTAVEAEEDLCKLSGYATIFECSDRNFDKHGPSNESDRAAYATALARWYGRPTTSRVFNLHGSVTHNDFTYYDAPSTKHITDRTGWKFGGEVGTTVRSLGSYFGAGFDFMHGYKEDKDKTVCPSSDAASFECISGKFAAPKDQVGRQLYAETRSWFAAWAYSVRVAHDFATHDDAIDVPIYLFGSKDAVFTGGVRVGWTTDDHFLAGVFVGKPFDLYKTSQ